LDDTDRQLVRSRKPSANCKNQAEQIVSQLTPPAPAGVDRPPSASVPNWGKSNPSSARWGRGNEPGSA